MQKTHQNNYEIITLNYDAFNPKKLNELIDKYKGNVRYLSIARCDIEISEPSKLVESNIEYLIKYDLPTIFYGFSRGYEYKKNNKTIKCTNNIVINVNNPAVYLQIDDEYINIVRNIMDSFIVIDLDKIGNIKFNEDIQVLFYNLFVYDVYKLNNKLFGLFIENPKNIEYIKSNKIIHIDEQRLIRDSKIFKAQNIKENKNVTEIIDYIKEHYENYTNRK